MLLFVFLGLYFRGKAEGGLAGFFLGGRKLPWYIAGVSMVATTFAADTPLWVTEKIAQHGISGNWLYLKTKPKSPLQTMPRRTS